jgi:hypothetical protein
VRGGSTGAGVGREASIGSKEGEGGREGGEGLKDTDMWVPQTTIGIGDGT